MSISALVVLAVLATGPDAKALVARLGSADPAERAETAGAVEALGVDALPALYEASRGDDPDLRDRAQTLWDAIQRKGMTRPSLVRLDGRNRPLADVLKDLAGQSGLSLRASQGPRPGAVDLREPDPVPFWSAIERLGLNGVYHQNEGRGRFPTLDLRDDLGWDFTSSAGPFRVALTGLHLHRDRQLIRGPWVRIDRFGQRIGVDHEGEDRGPGPVGESAAFYGGLLLMVEPRVWFTQEAPARLVEARNDLGQSLVPEAPDDETRFHDGAHFAFYAGSGVTESTSEFRLRIPERPGRVVHLRGVVPVMLHLRRPDPALVIPLTDAAGKTFRSGEVEIAIDTVNDSPTGTSVTMTVRLDAGKADLPEHPDPELITTRLRVLGAHQLQLTDAAGSVLADGAGSGGGGGRTPEVYRWTISSRNGRATHLRYFGMLRAGTEAAFDFRDVPLP
jgi:hypothetical protein